MLLKKGAEIVRECIKKPDSFQGTPTIMDFVLMMGVRTHNLLRPPPPKIKNLDTPQRRHLLRITFV